MFANKSLSFTRDRLVDGEDQADVGHHVHQIRANPPVESPGTLPGQ